MGVSDESARAFVAVGTPVAQTPPHRSVRAELLHTAPTLDEWRRSARSDADAGFPLSTLRCQPRGWPRMTRGQDGSLRLSCRVGSRTGALLRRSGLSMLLLPVSSGSASLAQPQTPFQP